MEQRTAVFAAAILATLATLAIASCDLPTTVEEARAHLGADQEERIVPIQLPLPSISVKLSEQLGQLSGIVDTTDLTFRVAPDTFAFGLDSLLAVAPVDPDPVSQGYVIDVADFTRDINVTLPAVPLTLPGASETLPLAPATPAGSVEVPVDLSATFADATFAVGSSFEVVLTTDAASSINDVAASLEDSGGATLASAPGTVSLGPSSTDTLTIDLGGVTLPATFDLVLAHTGASGDAGGDELTVEMAFIGAQVEAASGVDASAVTPVSFSDTVTLDQTGGDFSEAELSAGTVAVTSFTSGTLEFTPTFSGDLAGLQVGGGSPGELVVSGDVGPPAGAGTVDVTNSADITIEFSGLEVASVTLNQIDMTVDQALTIEGDSALDNLARLTIASGGLQIDIANRLGVGGPVTLTLAGAVDAAGDTVTAQIDLQASPDGSPVVTSETVDLAGVVMTPADLAPRIEGTISGTDITVTPDAAADAITVDPLLDIQPQEVVLARVPDTEVVLDERVALAASDIDIGELGDLLDGISFNDISFTVTLDNGTGLDLEIDGFRMTLLDASGQPVVVDGDTAVVALAGDTTGSVQLPASTATEVSGAATTFVNALLDEIAAGRDVEVAATGSAGPAADSGSIALGDSVVVVFAISLGPDITIDPSGIVFDRVIAEALDVGEENGDLLSDLAEDLVSAAVEFEVINGMPLGLSVQLALAPTPTDTAGFDPFTADPNISLPAFVIDAAAVDADGRVTGPTTSEPVASVDPAEFSVLAEGLLGMGFRAEVLGPEGGRARLQPTDSLVLRPLLSLEIRVAGGAGGNE